MTEQKYKNKTSSLQSSHDTETMKYYELLAFYDCLTNIAYALTLRNSNRIDDAEYALLNQTYMEIILLTGKGGFLDGRQDVCQAIDQYVKQRLPTIGSTFPDRRTIEQRMRLNIDLLMREQSLHSIHIMLKMSQTLCYIKTPEPLQIWDQALDLSFLNSIEELKKNYVLLDRIPPSIAYPTKNADEEKHLTNLLGLHHASKVIPAEIYTNGKTQFFFLHHLLQIVISLSKLSTELPLFSLPELCKKPVSGLPDADAVFNSHIESITDCTITILSACEKGPSMFNAVITPTMKGMIATNHALSYAADLIAQLPRKKRADRVVPDNIRKKIVDDTRWLNYRQRSLDQAKHKLL